MRDLARLVLLTKPTTLAKHEDELTFLSSELDRAREKDITPLGWLDFFESFQSLLLLRSRITDPCCQSILDAILVDQPLLDGLAAAQALSVSRIDTPPPDLLKMLKAGPGKHLKNRGYVSGQLSILRSLGCAPNTPCPA